jgi:hypothetical protein
MGSTNQFRRERRQKWRNIVSEIFSPPRVTAELRRMKDMPLLPGFAIDLTTNDPQTGEPWDLNNVDKQEKVRKMIREQRPLFVIGSPECRASARGRE